VSINHNLIGLARVSTDAQDAQLQQDTLALAGCGRVHVEKISTRKTATERPASPQRSTTCAAVTRSSSGSWTGLGRSVKELLTIADDLHARGIAVRILTGKLAGSYSPAGEGKFFFTMMAAFAELERDLIHERTMAGLAAAEAQGRTGSRPTVMDAYKLAAARARRARGESPAKIAKASASAAPRSTASGR
jgi:DNA invertase Pin-like site-specific DNA recombinase